MKNLILGILLIPSIAMASNEETLCLATNVYFESGIEDVRGKMAVAQVTLNRVEDPRWPDTVCGVVYQPKQFSWTLEDKSIVYNMTWFWSVAVATQALKSDDPRIRATHYYAPEAMIPAYRVPFWAEGKLPDFVLGGHVFYFLKRGS